MTDHPEPRSKPDYAAVQIAYMRQILGRPRPPRPPPACAHCCPVHCPAAYQPAARQLTLDEPDPPPDDDPAF
jgi:hypothetical protein